MKKVFAVTEVFALLCLGTLAQAVPVQWAGNGHWYERADVQINWWNAKTAAENQSGYLATITSAQEQAFLVASMGGDQARDHWFGAYQNPSPGGAWTWITGEPWSYSNWASWEPDGPWNGNPSSMFWYGGLERPLGLWADNTCDWVMDGYIVEWNTNPVPEPSSTIALGSGILALAGMIRRRNG